MKVVNTYQCIILRGSYMTEVSEWNKKPVQAVAWHNCASKIRVNKGLLSPVSVPESMYVHGYIFE